MWNKVFHSPITLLLGMPMTMPSYPMGKWDGSFLITGIMFCPAEEWQEKWQSFSLLVLTLWGSHCHCQCPTMVQLPWCKPFQPCQPCQQCQQCQQCQVITLHKPFINEVSSEVSSVQCGGLRRIYCCKSSPWRAAVHADSISMEQNHRLSLLYLANI